jgi:hypothetical protein
MGHINWPINIFLGMFGNVLLSDTHIDIFWTFFIYLFILHISTPIYIAGKCKWFNIYMILQGLKWIYTILHHLRLSI